MNRNLKRFIKRGYTFRAFHLSPPSFKKYGAGILYRQCVVGSLKF